MLTTHVRIGVVIPSYNRPEAVRRAVASVARQRQIDEVIVVDDASPQPVTLEGLASERVRLVRRARNGGVCAARNTGTEAATASHLLYLDDDDTLLPWAGRALRRWATRNPGRVVAGSILVRKRGQRPGWRRPPSSAAGEIWGLDAGLAARGHSINTKQAALIPKDLVEAIGGWDEALRSRSSSEFFYRLTARAPVEGRPLPIYVLDRNAHEKLTADPVLRAESHAYIRKKHADLLVDPHRRALFEQTHEAMLRRGGAMA